MTWKRYADPAASHGLTNAVLAFDVIQLYCILDWIESWFDMKRGTAAYAPEHVAVPGMYAAGDGTQTGEIDRQVSIDTLPGWLMEQTGLNPPDGQPAFELSSDGVAAMGRILVDIAGTFGEGSESASVRMALGVIESLTSGGLDAACRRYKTANVARLNDKVGEFGAIVRAIGEDMGPENMRGIVLKRLAAARGISLSGVRPTVELFNGVFTSAPKSEQVRPVGGSAQTVKPRTATRAARIARPQTPANMPQSANVARVPTGDDEGMELEAVDDDEIKREVDGLVATLEKEERAGSSGQDTDLVRTYLVEIGKKDRLSAEQEVELAKCIEAGKYAEKILECARAEDPELHRMQLIVSTFHDLNRYGTHGEEIDELADMRKHPDRLQAAKERVDLLIQAVKGHLAPYDGVLPASHAEELEYIVARGEVAKNAMIEANLRLVVYWAKRRKGDHLKQLDIIQEGNLGLIKAVEMFDYMKGYKFSTYASWWIRQAIGRGLGNGDRMIRIPIHVLGDISKLGRLEEAFQMNTGHMPNPSELAVEMGVSEDEVVELIRQRRKARSLDETFGDDGSQTLHDVIADKETDTRNSQDDSLGLANVIGLIDMLPGLLDDDELLLATQLFGLGGTPACSIREIADLQGCARETVHRARTRILLKLLHPSSPTRLIIAQALGIDHDDLSGPEANCRDTSTAEFFSRSSRTDIIRTCGGCALRTECLREGLVLGAHLGTKNHNQSGIFGGTNPRQRNALMRKDDDLIKRISGESSLVAAIAA